MLFKNHFNRLAKTIISVLLFIGIISGTVLFLQYNSGNSYIVKAGEALSAGDPDTAEEYLKKVDPKSRYYPQAQSLLNDITTEQKYRKIADLCRLDKSYSPDASALYANTAKGLEEYLKKLVDAGKYGQALYIIENIDPSLKTETIEKTEKAIHSALEETTQSPLPRP